MVAQLPAKHPILARAAKTKYRPGSSIKKSRSVTDCIIIPTPIISQRMRTKFHLLNILSFIFSFKFQ
jgi:hypothetical protein